MKQPRPTFTPIPPRPLLGERGEPARRALLMAGAQIFGEKGLEGATTREIAAKAGQNISAINYYFESKEGLYLAIARAISEEMGMRIGRFSADLAARDRKPTPREAMNLLKRVISVMAHTMLMDDFPAIAQFMVREQQNPTPAFDVIYEGGMRGTHEMLTELMTIAFGLPRDSTDAVLRAHAVLGQVLGFRVAHATLLRRTGWVSVGAKEIDAVVNAICAGLELMFAGRTGSKVATGARHRATRTPSFPVKDSQ